MEVTVTKTSDNRTLIKIYSPAFDSLGFAYNEKRFKVYTPAGDSYTITTGYVGIGAPLSHSFYIEDYPDYFIKPLTNRTKDTFRVQIEGRTVIFGVVSDWYAGEKQEHTYNIYSNAWTQPTLSMSVSAVNPMNNYYRNGQTSVKATLSGATKLGASVQSYKVECDGKSYTSTTNEITTSKLANSGWINVIATLTDTRGFTATATQKIWVINDLPTLNVLSGSETNSAITYQITPACPQAYSKMVVQTKVGNTYTDLTEFKIGQTDNSDKIKLLSEAELDKLYRRYPSSINTYLKFILHTYRDSSYSDKMEDISSREIMLTIPETSSSKPIITINSVGYTSNAIGYKGFIKGKSKAQINYSASGRYDASIVSTHWSVNGSGQYINGGTSDYIASSGDIPIKITATDTRGFTNVVDTTINVLDYSPPLITNAEVKRVEKSPISSSFSNLQVTAGMNFSQYEGNLNKCTMRCRFKVGASWENDYTKLKDGATSNVSSLTEVVGRELLKDAVYYIEISAIDSFGDIGTRTLVIPTEAVFMDRRGQAGSIAFGGHSTKDKAFEVYQTPYFYKNLMLVDLESGITHKVIIADDGTLKAIKQ